MCNIHEYTNKYTGEAVMPYCLEHDSDADYGSVKCHYREGFEKALTDRLIGMSVEELLKMDLTEPLVIEAIAQKKEKSPVTFVEKLKESRK